MADPVNHCALNVALYGPRAGRWSMTERHAAQVRRERHHLSLGPSTLSWTGDALDIGINEICAPVPRRLRGAIRLTPAAIGARSYILDAAGRHRWTPFAPCAHVDVRLADPDLTWSGVAYMDMNVGAEPLEDAFRAWTWSRASVPVGAATPASTVVLYDVTPRAAPPHSLALHFAPDGTVQAVEAPPVIGLPTTGWRVARETRADAGHGARVVRTLEDAPFYSRSQLETHLLGRTAPAIHESLDLNRFRSTWVQCLLPFRMPRRAF
jgi:carotenoid 1,2-hydratase